MGQAGSADLPDGTSEIFFPTGLDSPNHVEVAAENRLCAHGVLGLSPNAFAIPCPRSVTIKIRPSGGRDGEGYSSFGVDDARINRLIHWRRNVGQMLVKLKY
jgi:hypothetical protein